MSVNSTRLFTVLVAAMLLNVPAIAQPPAKKPFNPVPFMQGPDYSSGTKPVVKYSTVDGAERYAVEIFRGELKNAFLQELIQDGKVAKFVPKMPLAAGWYGVHVRSYVNKQWSDWSRTLKFFVDPDLDQEGGIEVNPQTCETGDPMTELIGKWRSIDNGRGGKTQLTEATNNKSLATWNFKIQPGLFRVYARWVTRSDNAPDVIYSLFDGAEGRLKSSHTVDQTKPPVGFDHGGTSWTLLGDIECQQDTLQVLVDDNVLGNVVADAIHIIPLRAVLKQPKANEPSKKDDRIIDIFQNE